MDILLLGVMDKIEANFEFPKTRMQEVLSDTTFKGMKRFDSLRKDMNIELDKDSLILKKLVDLL